MGRNMKVTIKMERSTGKGHISGAMALCMWVSGSIIKSTVKVCIPG
jgi:hypothetical protein